jgi:hypothetical protein
MWLVSLSWYEVTFVLRFVTDAQMKRSECEIGDEDSRRIILQVMERREGMQPLLMS